MYRLELAYQSEFQILKSFFSVTQLASKKFEMFLKVTGFKKTR